MITRFSTSIHVGMHDLDAADVDCRGCRRHSIPPLFPDAEKAAVYNTALQLAMHAKHYDKAVKYAKLYHGDHAAARPAKIWNWSSRALFQGGDYAGATAMAQKNIDAATAAGQKPARNDLDIILAAQVKQKDEAGRRKDAGDSGRQLQHAG